MNNEIFQRARESYLSRDFETALQSFTDCLQENPSALLPGEMGLIYHQIGNCLVKLNDYNEAIHAYTQAAADSAYDACGTVNYNLGMAYAALHDFEDAVQHFEIAVSDAKYDTPYKAYTGMGNAYLKLGKSAEAGAAFRSAALDEANPDPTKALLNLGICFMALNRPKDAVASYESALQFEMPAATRNKLYANLGQAYVACNEMQKAASAFEEALADKTYFLSASANVDYQRAIAMVASGTTSVPEIKPLSEQGQEKPEPVVPQADMSGLDVTADGQPVAQDSAITTVMDPYYYPDTYAEDGKTSEERFFTATEDEIEKWSRGIAKQERKHRNWGLKLLVFFITLLLLAFAGGVFAYVQGYGFPSQTQVVKDLFAHKDTAAGSVFAKEVSQDRIKSIMPMVVDDANPQINGTTNTLSTSEVYVTAKTVEGGDINYRVSLVRDGLGWKVANVDLYFPSRS